MDFTPIRRLARVISKRLAGGYFGKDFDRTCMSIAVNEFEHVCFARPNAAGMMNAVDQPRVRGNTAWRLLGLRHRGHCVSGKDWSVPKPPYP